MPDIETATRELVAALRAEIVAASVRGPEPDRLLALPDAADALCIGRSMLYGEIAAGRLRTIRVGRRRLVPSSAVNDYIASAAPPD
jgi:excisionase family DNA binding protein